MTVKAVRDLQTVGRRQGAHPWFTNIPGHWRVLQLKQALSANDGGVWGENPEGTGDTIVLRSTDMTLQGRWHVEDPARRRLTHAEIQFATLRAGDLLMTKSSGSALHLGKTALVDGAVEALGACFSNFMQRLRPAPGFDPRFMFWFLNSPIGREEFNYFGTTTTGLANLSGGLIGALRFPCPPISEQRAIADYLDRETARIDALVDKKQQLIELLEERARAQVFQTITQGIGGENRLVGSDVEAFPWVPAGWQVLPLRRLGVDVQTGPFGSALHADDYVIGGVPVLNPANIVDGRLVPYESVTVDQETKARLNQHVLEPGDVIFGRRGELGRAALVTSAEAGWLCGTGCLRVRFHRRVLHPPYLDHFLRSATKQYLEAHSIGSTMGNLSSAILLSLPVLVPSFPEQQAISRYCDDALKRCERLVESVRAQVNLLTERRQTLITAAVTGQLDVSQVAA